MRELHRVFPDAVIRTTFQMTDAFKKRERVETVPMDLYYGWSAGELERARHEVRLARGYRETGALSESTPYIDEVLRSDLVVDFSSDMWSDNGDLAGSGRLEAGMCKDRTAQLLGKPTALVAVSPGPIANPEMLAFARETYANFDLVTNREPVSTRLLKAAGFDVSRTYDCACPAFLFEKEPDEQTCAIVADLNRAANGRPLIGFAICGWNFPLGPFDRAQRADDEFAVFAKAVDLAVNELGGEAVMISHANGFTPPPAPFRLLPGRDYPLAAQLAEVARKRYGLRNIQCVETPLLPKQIKALMGHFEMMVSGRVHGAVAALSQGVPTVIIDYGHEPKAHKLQGFAEVAGVTEFVADPVDEAGMMARIRKCWEDRESVRRGLNERMPSVAALARRNADLVAELCGARLS